MTTKTTKCDHFFCTLGGKDKVASYKVTQVFPKGEVITYVCESDMHAMSSVLTPSDIVIKL